MNRRSFIVGVGGLVLAATGCTSPKDLLEVSGDVNMDGKPLPKGTITFIPEDKTLGPEGGEIKDGKYKLKSKQGKMRVEIQAVREVPGKFGPMGTEPLLENAIGPEFNTNSKLTAEVSSSKKSFNFDVTSLPPSK